MFNIEKRLSLNLNCTMSGHKINQNKMMVQETKQRKIVGYLCFHLGENRRKIVRDIKRRGEQVRVCACERKSENENKREGARERKLSFSRMKVELSVSSPFLAIEKFK